jgi:hypothetical protein
VLRFVEVAVLAVLFLCTVTMLVIRVSRAIVAFSIRMLFLAAVVTGLACYVLGEVGVL